MKQTSNTVPCACTTIRKANRSLFRFYEKAMAGTGVSITQFSILRALNRKGPTALSVLADTLVMERTSLYRTIAPMVEGGSIALANGNNKKIKVAALTPAGTARMESAKPQWEAAQQQFTAAIGEDEWTALSSLLLSVPTIVSDLK